MYSITVIVLCIGIVAAHKDFKEIDKIQQESQCSSQGGICTLAVDCPEGRLTEEKGLCPRQRSNGVECCFALSKKETRCQKRGGQCVPGPNPCNPIIIDRIATDCPKDTTCCILIQ